MNVHTNEASVKEVMYKIVEKLREEGDTRDPIELSMGHMIRWFKIRKGRNYRPKPLLYLSNSYKVDRVNWDREMKNMVG